MAYARYSLSGGGNPPERRPPGRGERLERATMPAPPRQVLLDELTQARLPEAVEVPGVHDADRKPCQPLHRGAAGLDTGVVEVVNQFAVVNRIAREQRAVALIVQPDGAGRMPGQVQQRKDPVPQVDRVSLQQTDCRWCRAYGVAGRTPAPARHCIDWFLELTKQVRARPAYQLAANLTNGRPAGEPDCGIPRVRAVAHCRWPLSNRHWPSMPCRRRVSSG